MNELSKEAVRQVEVDEASAGQRIDNFLARTLKDLPRSLIYRILRTGEVRVNGGRAKPWWWKQCSRAGTMCCRCATA